MTEISNAGSGLPNRYVLHGVEKIGKSSLATFAPSPIFLETKGETGLETLIDSGRVKATDHFPELQTWESLIGAITALCAEEHSYKTLVIDTLNGAERLCHEFVCTRDFSGDWGEHGFVGWQRGFEVSLAEWRRLLSALDSLRSQKKMTIFCLCHSKIKTFNNPEGADYDNYRPDMHDKTWSLTHKWADVILFANYETFVTESDPDKKGKGRRSQERIIYTDRHPAFVAGNRLGLVPEISMGTSAEEAWSNFAAALKTARAGKDSENHG